MHRQAQAVVLLLLGGAVLKVSLTDTYLRYVKSGLRPFLIAAGALLVVAAVMTLVHDLRRPRVPAPTDGHDDHGHRDHGHDAHGHHEPRVGWLLLLPVLGLLLISPPALGSYAADQSGTALSSQRADVDYPPLPAGDPVTIGVLDYASRAIFDRGASLADRRLRIVGFIASDPETEPILARIILSCCAADGRPIKIGMTGEPPSGLARDTWVQVIGRYVDRTATDPVNGQDIPYLHVESWQLIDPPKRPYE